ncbi:hypothetical protein JCM15765_13670 [Paradesulfitobacterium aromaticivorans]
MTITGLAWTYCPCELGGCGVSHEVWFTDATSFITLLDLVNKHALNGICLWHPGEEDPKIYDAIRAKL